MSKLPAITFVGVFGRFRYGGRELVETWLALEAIAHEKSVWADTAEDLISYGWRNGILTAKEYQMFKDALEGAQ